MHPQSRPLIRSLTHQRYRRGQCRTYMLMPMPNMHARRCGHGHAAPLCWMPQTTARSFPSPPHSSSTHLYTPERRDTSFLYIARVRVGHGQSKFWGSRRCRRPFLLFFAWLNASSSYLSNASGLASCSSLWTSISSRHPAGHLLRAIVVELHLKIYSYPCIAPCISVMAPLFIRYTEAPLVRVLVRDIAMLTVKQRWMV